MKWLGTLELELVDLTRPDRPRAGAVLAQVHDPTLPHNSLSRYRLVCPPAVHQHMIEQKHTKGHWRIRKTVQAIQERYCWPLIHQQVTQFMMRECWPCIENERANLKEGIHVPRVAHEQGEIVYVDLVGPFSNKVPPHHHGWVQ